MLLFEDQVSLPTVRDLLLNGALKAGPLEGDTFMVFGDMVNAQVRLEEEKKIIHLVFLQKLQYLSMAEACHSCNTANSTLSYVRFSAEVDVGIYLQAHATVDYAKALVASHLVRGVILFEQVVEHAMRRIFTKYL